MKTPKYNCTLSHSTRVHNITICQSHTKIFLRLLHNQTKLFCNIQRHKVGTSAAVQQKYIPLTLYQTQNTNQATTFLHNWTLHKLKITQRQFFVWRWVPSEYCAMSAKLTDAPSLWPYPRAYPRAYARWLS